MTIQPLTFAFPMMSPIAERPPHAIGRDEQLIALQAELDLREASDARMIGRTMSAEEARRHNRIWKMLIEEATLSVHIDHLPHEDLVRRDAALRTAPWTWADRVREIRRALGMRRNSIPKAILAFRMTPEDGRLQLERLDALHWIYWFARVGLDEGPDWTGVAVEDCRAICRALQAQRDEWLIDAVDAGDPAACAYTVDWREEQWDVLRAELGWNARFLPRLAELRPDLAAEPAREKAA